MEGIFPVCLLPLGVANNTNFTQERTSHAGTAAYQHRHYERSRVRRTFRSHALG